MKIVNFILFIILVYLINIVADRLEENKARRVLYKLESYGIRFPEVALAQMWLETGRFKSKIFKENNNLFGMKRARIRPSTNAGENRGHASYSSIEDSINDYVLWQEYFMPRYENNYGKIETIDDYIRFLQPIYAEDPNYREKLTKLVAKIEVIKNN